MTHPKYTAKYLLRKGISYCKQIAKELGITPEGDKRQLFTWVEAIVEHQAKLQPVEEVKPQTATIDYDNSIDGTVEGEYMVIVDGVVVRRFRTYIKAEKWAVSQYTLVTPQEVAQTEFEADLAEQDSYNFEDDRFDIPVFIPEEPTEPTIEFVSPTGFGDWEAMVDGETIATIEQDFDAGVWMVGDVPFGSYVEAEQFIRDKFAEEGFRMSRGSGRVTPVIESLQLTIEDVNFVDPKGQQYAVRARGVLAGYIWLDDSNGWTLNGEDFEEDWQPVASELVRLTRHDYLLLAA